MAEAKLNRINLTEKDYEGRALHHVPRLRSRRDFSVGDARVFRKQH